MQTETSSFIAILGISDNEDRYSYKAYKKLLENGYKNLIGITPKNISLPAIETVKTLAEIKKPIHTLTIYLSHDKLDDLTESIIKLSPKRIIFNPGTENEKLIKKVTSHNIEIIRGCTLVLLSTDQF
ncbi:MAG: hypothetical protein A2202_08045 [Bdellovibrionales bacterium RIFOXYA1_FULL_36_14]|nr:MAG: hypothetical protein A2202_08045 [Bdellovibrionales bacterium RIFOXYA1_FULL_36_14]